MAKIIVNKKNIDIIINAKKIFPTLENLEITPRAFEQNFNHPNSYGYDKVTVKAMEIKLQDKEATPTKETQEITADNNYNGLSKVTVNKIPDEYIIPAGSVDIIANGTYDVTDKVTANVNIPMPTGTIEITENGTHNVKDKEFANVNVQPALQEKTVTITENGTTITQNDSEYDGLSKVTSIVNVPKPELGEKTISTNGTYNSSDDSLDGYSKVIVNVPEKQLGTKTITSNGLYKATDDNLDGYSEVNVETSGVDINNYFITSPTITNESYLLNKLIKNIPMIDTSNVTYMTYMFYYCASLKTIPLLDTSNVINMGYMFYGCKSLQEIPVLNTSKVTNMWYMFYDCSSLNTIPLLDTPNAINMSYMFGECKSLQEIPALNTSKVTNMSYMFEGCNSLQEIPALDTSKVTSMGSMLYGCSKLKQVSFSNTSALTNLSRTFYGCTTLEQVYIPETGKVTNCNNTFNSCSNLQTINKLDGSSLADISAMFSSCSKLANFGGIENLGKSYSTSASKNYIYYKLDLHYCTLLTHDSLMNVINGLYDIATKGCNTQQLVLGSTNLAKLTAEEIAIATSKGFSVS